MRVFPLRPLVYGAVAAAVLVLDQATKLAVSAAELTRSVPVLPGFFQLTYRENRGGAWGLLAGASESFRMPFFLITSTLAVAFLFLLRPRFPLRRAWNDLAFPLILGGALGNLVDRARMGYVVDFLDGFVGGWHWPTFNVADIGITVGVAMLAVDALFRPHEAPAGAGPLPDDPSPAGMPGREPPAVAPVADPAGEAPRSAGEAVASAPAVAAGEGTASAESSLRPPGER